MYYIDKPKNFVPKADSGTQPHFSPPSPPKSHGIVCNPHVYPVRRALKYYAGNTTWKKSVGVPVSKLSQVCNLLVKKLIETRIREHQT